MIRQSSNHDPRLPQAFGSTATFRVLLQPANRHHGQLEQPVSSESATYIVQIRILNVNLNNFPLYRAKSLLSEYLFESEINIDLLCRFGHNSMERGGFYMFSGTALLSHYVLAV